MVTATRTLKIVPPDNSRLAYDSRMTLIESDYKLARAVANGNVNALGELYQRHYRQVYALCLGMMRNPTDAEDLTQDVFVHLVRKIGSYRGESRFSTWLHRLTVNLVLMHMRRPMRREQTAADYDNVQPLLPRLKERVPVQIVDRIALQLAVGQLPRGCRTVFVLFAIAGYKHDEIAKMLGCSEGTSKSQLHRARVKLKRILRPRLA
ncbi:MAG TPA: sigma-70 family RNA polymerase sigma factor [Pyrinomonadaceae bacterium]|jgi:RNA polymerase sigma-70 factor (ECF subfamily)|nr:sigma-70 family RNA polymerase sigma factor [Pyrinomonadaceae bacterium]